MKVRTKLKACFIPFLLGIACTAAAGQTIYVDSDAAGANDGSSWKNAYNFLQDALADANSAAKPVEIRVAEGIYTPDSNSVETNGTGDRTATFQLINDVAIKGGYAGFGEPDPNARDIELYETILSGDLNGNDGPNFANNSENSFHIVSGSGTDPNAVLDGFMITGGNADGSYPDGSGGGMYNYEGSPTIANCMFSGNAAVEGGGVHNYNSSPTIANCTFKGNSSRASGGGMYNYGDNSPTLTNCIFSGNSAVNQWSAGGGMYNLWCSPTLTNCTFSGNWAVYGATVCNDECGPTIMNSIFWDEEYGIWDYDSWTKINYSDVRGGYSGEGNIDADPCFVDPENSDYRLKSEGWRWDANRKVWTWDEITSPCIDAGNPGCGLGDELLSVPDDPNNEWGENLRINMGAYGGTAQASMALPGWALLPDLTNDRIIDFNDLAMFVRYWLGKGLCIPSDLDRDGSVDLADFVLIADDWLRDNNP